MFLQKKNCSGNTGEKFVHLLVGNKLLVQEMN